MTPSRRTPYLRSTVAVDPTTFSDPCSIRVSSVATPLSPPLIDNPNSKTRAPIELPKCRESLSPNFFGHVFQTSAPWRTAPERHPRSCVLETSSVDFSLRFDWRTTAHPGAPQRTLGDECRIRNVGLRRSLRARRRGRHRPPSRPDSAGRPAARRREAVRAEARALGPGAGGDSGRGA